jgi:glycine cleavage system transcriptional repressor
LAKLENQLADLQTKLDLTIISRRTETSNAAEKTLPYSVEVVALDHPGIVYNLAGFFSNHNINIQDMTTSTYAAAHTGSPMFAVQMTITIPSTIQLSAIRDEFMDYCDSLNLDAILEPIKG